MSLVITYKTHNALMFIRFSLFARTKIKKNQNFACSFSPSLVRCKKLPYLLHFTYCKFNKKRITFAESFW